MSAPATRLLLVLFRAFFWSDCVRLLVVPDDFLAKMGFVPPPPPPPWGFNKDGNSTAEIEERVMRYALSSALCSLLSALRWEGLRRLSPRCTLQPQAAHPDLRPPDNDDV